MNRGKDLIVHPTEAGGRTALSSDERHRMDRGIIEPLEWCLRTAYYDEKSSILGGDESERQCLAFLESRKSAVIRITILNRPYCRSLTSGCRFGVLRIRVFHQL